MTARESCHQRRRPTRDSAGPALGVDIGKVIADEDAVEGISLLTEYWELTPFTAGAVEALSQLNTDGGFAGQVHLISKAGPKVQQRTRDWLQLSGFHDTTQIPADRLHFVRDHHEKAPVARRLGVTHFVDDRIAVLTHMDFARVRFLFSLRTPPQIPEWATHVRTWSELMRHLTEVLSVSRGDDGGVVAGDDGGLPGGV